MYIYLYVGVYKNAFLYICGCIHTSNSYVSVYNMCTMTVHVSMWVYINMCTYIYIYVGFRKVLNSRSVCFNPAIALIIPNYTSIQAWTPGTGPPQLRTGAASRPIDSVSEQMPQSRPALFRPDATIWTTCT